MKPELKFTAGNFNYPQTWLTLSCSFLFALGSCWIAKKESSPLFFILAACLLLAFIFFTIKWFAKITIDQNGITSKSFVKQKTILWSELQSYGGFISTKYKLKFLKKSSLREFYFGLKELYVSKNSNAPTKLALHSSSNISFTFNLDAYIKITEIIATQNLTAKWNSGISEMECCN